MKLLAFSDIHSPKYLPKLRHVLEKHKSTIASVDLVLIAGDLTKKGSIQGLAELVKTLREYLDEKSIVACPGNEDFEEVVSKIKQDRSITMLDDEETELKVGEYNVKIYGTRGVLDKPTVWQRKNIKNIDDIYENRLRRLREILSTWRNSDKQLCIILSHYAITYNTLEGEDRRIWQHLGTCRLDACLGAPVLVIHGHAHNSIKRAVKIGSTLILNVAFPGAEGVFLVDVKLPDNYRVSILKADSVSEVKPQLVKTVKSSGTVGSKAKVKSGSGSILDFLK